MSLAQVFAEGEAIYAARVQAETFGHLAPERGQVYSGSIVLAHSPYGGESVPVEVTFDGLPDSPWFYDGLCEFIEEHREDSTEGKVFRFTGTYELVITPPVLDDEGWEIDEGSHEHRFTGDITEISLAVSR